MCVRLLTVGAALGAVLCLASVSPPDAWACTHSSHCHASTRFDTTGDYTGAIANVKASNFAVVSGGLFVTQEMWVGTNNDPKACCGLRWVEIGLQRNYAAAPEFFWAEGNPVSGTCSPTYLEHTVSTATLGTTYTGKIAYSGQNRWAVYLNGTYLAQTAPCMSLTPYSHWMAAGLESTDNGNVVNGWSWAFQKRASDNSTWSYNWGGATLISDPGTDAFGYPTADAGVYDRQNCTGC
jgi:hypothetical protein